MELLSRDYRSHNPMRKYDVAATPPGRLLTAKPSISAKVSEDLEE
jgi:hypothetical protein